MQYVQNLSYKPTADNQDNVALVTLLGATDTQWSVSPIGSVDGSATNVNPAYVAVNNILGKTGVLIANGPIVQFCPPFTVQTYRLAVPSSQVTFTVDPAANVQVYFDQTGEFVSSLSNYLAIQQAARGVNLYPYVIYNAALSPQQANDANSVVEFAGAAIVITYNLLQVAGNVSNGWFQFVFNNGTKPASIVPFGADTIDSIFNNATPFILFPGEFGILSSDGTQWFLKVFGAKLPTVTHTAFSTTQLPSDLNRRLRFAAGAGQSYTLLSSTNFTNGDRLKVKNANAPGGQVVAIVPFGAELINATFTAGAPLFLYPGDEVELLIDDTGAWSADGTITFTSPLQQFNANIGGTIAHGMGGIPNSLDVWVQCIGVEINYAVGDVFKMGTGTASTLTNGGENVFSPNAANIYWFISPNNGIRLPNKTTGASSNVASGATYLTNFELFFTASRRL